MITLAIDASTYVGTIALIEDRALLAHESAEMRGIHEERLMPAVARVLGLGGLGERKGKVVGGGKRGIDRIVCGAGPGSFTSLRIAGSLSKGLAVGWGRSLFGVSSLALIVGAGAAKLPPGRYLPVLDALRGEHYVGGYEVAPSMEVTRLFPDRREPTSNLSHLAAEWKARVIGPHQEIGVAPNASGILHLESLISMAGPVDIATWEPAYGRLPEAQVRWEAARASNPSRS